jgi:eukaryotic-like serine/threonine-protein kinase
MTLSTCNTSLSPPVESARPSRKAPHTETIDGRYELEREIGRGGMGRVHLARDRGLDRKVAVKMVDPSLASDPAMLALFRREATALARVRSDHVVQVYAFGIHERAPFFAMEFVEGSDLESIIASYRSHGEVVPLHRAATILRQTASGLAAVHAQGLIHRDLKPSNVLVEAGTGRPVLIDFGLALPQTSSNEGPASIAGTPVYMAPEQWMPESAEISAATDVYAFGAMAFELLTGKPPFDQDTATALMFAHLTAEVPRASANRPPLAPLDAVLARSLAKSPADRFPDGRSLAAALDAALREALPEETPLPRTWMPPPMMNSTRGVRALVVDDDDSFRAFAGRALQIGFPSSLRSVREAASGEAALELARREMPDLLVLDFDMPGLNGLETLSHLRALPGGSRARVLVVSGGIEEIGRWQFDVLGVVDFAEKPVALRELAKRMTGMAKSSGA